MAWSHSVNILTINLLCSTLIFWIAARLYVLPTLETRTPQTILLPILLLHAFRHLGLMFLAPGATYPGIPAAFAYPGRPGRPVCRAAGCGGDSCGGERRRTAARMDLQCGRHA
jgi:hypothetical protein